MARLSVMIYKQYCIDCEECGHEGAYSDNYKDAAKEARAQGFKNVDGRTLCPECQGK